MTLRYLCAAGRGACLSLGLLTSAALADSGHGGHSSASAPIRADGHAPIGVMGDHLHAKGEVMLSYRFMRMEMDGSRLGTSGISAAEIATTIPNRFFGMPMQPPTLRVVPTDMTMDMHMFGAMYAPTDRVTLMAMIPYISKSMNHLTFAGPAGTGILGGFKTQSDGLGDIKVSALIGMLDRKTANGHHKMHLNLGISLPTGSITETGRILTPMGGRPVVRLPYSMQLGSGTYDLMPGITYAGQSGNIAWGAQARGIIRLGDNDEGYSLGNEAAVTGWVSYQPQPAISFSGRIEARSLGDIDGRDPRIMGPVQTADPDNYGGQTITLFAGVNYVVQRGSLRGNRFAIEAGLPLYRDLNGPQLETDWTVTAGWQYAF
ncbi:MAG: transporter [Pseudomonadota bacterium]